MNEGENLIRRHVESLGAGNVERALADYAENTTLHYPGSNQLSGTHSGRGEILEQDQPSVDHLFRE
jgi:hypothetical protein